MSQPTTEEIGEALACLKRIANALECAVDQGRTLIRITETLAAQATPKEEGAVYAPKFTCGRCGFVTVDRRLMYSHQCINRAGV